MTVQQAAHNILKEKNKPMPSKEIAKILLDRNLITSNSKNPVFSISTTIEKNIREGIYNDPELKVFFIKGRRLIGLPSWKNRENVLKTDALMDLQELRIKIPSTLMEKIQLATQARIKSSFEETVIMILQNGLSAIAPEIKQGLVSQLNKLDEL